MRVCLLTLCLLLSLSGAKRASKRSGNSHEDRPSRRHEEPVEEHDLRGPGGEQSIETVHEEKVHELLAENDRNVLVIFFESSSRCPGCKEALSVLEDIDDDLEGTGFIEVVKTADKEYAKDVGILTFPAVLYYRRKHPILYDGDFKDSQDFLRWIRAHEEVACVDLEDEDFEDRTDSASPPQGALDWFVLFHNSKKSKCSAYVAVWETVAHHLRGLVHVGKVDISESDDVAERFKIDTDEECPTFLLLTIIMLLHKGYTLTPKTFRQRFRRGKMYRYRDQAKDAKSLTQFALHRFKELRGHRVPDPPTKLEEIYEEMKEDIQDLLEENLSLVVFGGFAFLTLILVIWIVVKLISSKRAKPKPE